MNTTRLFMLMLFVGFLGTNPAQAQDHLYVDLTESLKAIGYKPFRYEGVPIKTRDDIIGALSDETSGNSQPGETHFYPFKSFAVNSSLEQFVVALDDRAFQLPEYLKKSDKDYHTRNKIVVFDLIQGNVDIQTMNHELSEVIRRTGDTGERGVNHKLLEVSSRTGVVTKLDYYSETLIRAEVTEKGSDSPLMSLFGHRTHYEFIDTVSEKRVRLSDELPYHEILQEHHLGLEYYIVAYLPQGGSSSADVRYAVVKFDPFTRSYKVLMDFVTQLMGRRIISGLIDEPGRNFWPQGEGDIAVYFDLETEFGPQPLVMIIDQDVVNFVELPSGKKPGPWIINTVNLVEDERSRYAFKGHYSTKWFFPAGVIEDVQNLADQPNQGHYWHRIGQQSVQLIEDRLVDAGYMNGGIMGVSYNNQTGEVGLQRSIYDAEALDSNPMAPVLSPSCGRVIK